MKLVAIVENVNQKQNRNLIGDIIVVDSEMYTGIDFYPGYSEDYHERYLRYDNYYSLLQKVCTLRHEVTNITILGVL